MSNIEAMLASPPERDELVVQLFIKDGGQWAEIYRDEGEYWIDVYRSAQEEPLRVPVSAMIVALSRAVDELRERLE